MAPATITSEEKGLVVIGNKRMAFARLSAVADTNTWDSGLTRIDVASVVQLGTQNAGNAIAISTFSGGTLTFGVTGTASDQFVVAIGT